MNNTVQATQVAQSIMDAAVRDVWTVIICTLGALAIIIFLSNRERLNGNFSARQFSFVLGAIIASCLCILFQCISWLIKPMEDGAEFLLILSDPVSLAFVFVPIAAIGGGIGVGWQAILTNIQMKAKSS